MDWISILQIWLASYYLCDVIRCSAGENCDSGNQEYSTSRPDWLANFIPANYSSRLPPPNGGCPNTVLVTFLPLGIGEISVQTMTIEVDMHLWIHWPDNRLGFPEVMTNSDGYVILNHNETKQVWKPVLTFKNCMHCEDIAYNLWSSDKLYITERRLMFQTRVANKFTCQFDLMAYPMDTQNCFVDIQGTDAKWTTKLQNFDRNDITADIKAIQVTEFKLVKLVQRNCTNDFLSNLLPCISYGFVLKRQMTYHLMLTYTPSMLIVILSWFSFWLDADASAPRVTIGLTSLLTLATQFANAQKNLPAVSYVKAIDVWMFVCMFMVFASLLEFSIANNFARLKRMQNVTPIKVISKYRGNVKVATKTGQQDGRRVVVDKVAQILFPVFYAIFNLCYWGYYLYILPHT